MRLFGAPKIEKLRTSGDVGRLIKALHHRDSSVRISALEALEPLDPISRARQPGSTYDDLADAHLVKMMWAPLFDARKIDALIESLDHPDSGVRHRVPEVLAKLGNPLRAKIFTSEFAESRHLDVVPTDVVTGG